MQETKALNPAVPTVRNYTQKLEFHNVVLNYYQIFNSQAISILITSGVTDMCPSLDPGGILIIDSSGCRGWPSL